MKRGNVPTQSWSGKSAVFVMESALTSHGSNKSNKKPSDGRGISDYTRRYPERIQVVSPSFINSALKIEIWKIPLQIFVFWML